MRYDGDYCIFFSHFAHLVSPFTSVAWGEKITVIVILFQRKVVKRGDLYSPVGFMWNLELRGHNASGAHAVTLYPALRKEVMEGRSW